MVLKRLAIVVVLLSVAVALITLSGCPKKEAPVAPPATGPVVPPAANAPAAPPSSASTKVKWTETPKVADIPDAPLAGMIDGKAFKPKTIRVKQGDKVPELEISDAKTDTPTGMIMNDTGASLDFPLTPGKAGEYVKDIAADKTFDKEHAFYYYQQGGDKGPMSVNPSWGAALQITEWTLTKDPTDDAVLGTVKGKVMIMYKDDKKSWVAGTFEGVFYK